MLLLIATTLVLRPATLEFIIPVAKSMLLSIVSKSSNGDALIFDK
jgi:hypothetical protein